MTKTANGLALSAIAVRGESLVAVLEVKHADHSGGERGAETFHRTSHVTSRTMTQPEGWPALPAAPAAKPNEMK